MGEGVKCNVQIVACMTSVDYMESLVGITSLSFLFLLKMPMKICRFWSNIFILTKIFRVNGDGAILLVLVGFFCCCFFFHAVGCLTTLNLLVFKECSKNLAICKEK